MDKRDNKIWLKKIKYPMIAFLISFLPRLYFALQMIPIRTASDEVATIATAAYLSGMDWSNVVSNAGYYGGGFSMLFFWIFKITDNPIVIYRTIMVLMALAQASISLVAYYIIKRFFKVKNSTVSVVFSCISSYMVVTRANVIFNETPMILVCWLIAVVLLQLVYNELSSKRKFFWTMVLFALMGYALTLHTRMIIMWICMGIFIVLYYIFDRKLFISEIAAIISVPAFYFMSQIIIKGFQKAIWLSGGSGETLRNAAVELPTSEVFNVGTLHGAFNIIIGNVNTISVFTGGFIILCIVFICQFFIQGLFPKRYLQSSTNYKNEYTLFLYYGICIAVTIVGLAVSWGNGAGIGINEGFQSGAYAFKAFTYVRYFGPFIGPIVLTGLLKVYRERNIKDLIPVSSIIFVVFQLLWVCCVLPYITTDSNSREVYMAFSLWSQGKSLGFLTYFMGTVVASLCFLVFVICIWKSRKAWMSIIFLVLLIYQYIYGSVYYDKQLGENNLVRIDDSYNFICDLENVYNLPEDLYVEDAIGRTDHQTFYLYQFWMNRYNIVTGRPSEELDEVIFFTNDFSKCVDLINDEYSVINLDYENDEYVLIKGEQLKEAVENAGYSMGTALFNTGKVYNVYSTMSLSENKDKNYKDKVRSNGNEGYLAYGQKIDLGSGVYEVKFNVNILDASNVNDVYAKCMVKNAGEILFEENVVDVNQSEIKIIFSADELNSVEFCLYVNSDIIVSLEGIEFQKLENKIIVGDLHEEDLENLMSEVNRIGIAGNVHYWAIDDKMEYDLSRLQKLYNNGNVYVEKQMHPDVLYLIADAEKIDIFSLISQYDILVKNKKYVFLANKENETMEKEVAAYNSDKGIRIDYFSDIKEGYSSDAQSRYSLPKGLYVLTAGYNMDLACSMFEFDIKCNGRLEKSIVCNQSDNEISSWLNLIEETSALEFAVRYNTLNGGNLEEIYIQKIYGKFEEELKKGTFDILGNEEYIKLVYEMLLKRSADEIGFDYWLSALEGGLPREDFYMSIINSIEYQELQQE